MWCKVVKAWEGGPPEGAVVELSEAEALFGIDRKHVVQCNGQELITKAREQARDEWARRLGVEALDATLRRGLSWKKDGADFLRAVYRHDRKYLAERFGSEFRHKEQETRGPVTRKAAMAESSGTTGGYAVPTAMAAEILSPLAELSFFRRNGAVQLPYHGRDQLVPAPDVTTPQAAGVPPWFGGLKFSWTEESQSRAESEPAWKGLELAKNELTGSLTISNALWADAPLLTQFLGQMVGSAVAWLEDFAFFVGDGAGMPQGVLNSPAALKVNRLGANLIQYQDASGMLAKLPPQSFNSACWAFTPTALPQLLQLKDGANRAVMLQGGGGPFARGPFTLLGLPAWPTDKLPALGTTGDLVLIDPRFYVIGDEGPDVGGALEITVSKDVDFLKNRLVVRVVRRTDGQPWIDKPITLADGASQASPFVVLN